MRFLTWCLIGCVASLYGMLYLASGSQALSRYPNFIYSKNEKPVRHYIEGGSIEGACVNSMTLQPFLTVNGKRVTKQVAGVEINQIVRHFELKYRITFNRSTTLGEYKCQAGNDSTLLFRLGYILSIPIRASSGLHPNEWKLKSTMSHCYTREGSDNNGKRHPFYPISNATISQLESLPVKKSIHCSMMSAGWIEFYILFYEKNVRFYIVQKKTKTKIDVTNRTEPIWLDSPSPFQCTVSVPGGLFVEAALTEVDSPTEPKLAEDSIELGNQKDISAPYTCWGYVYFYEQMGDMGFKELYHEKREIHIRYSTTAPESSTTLAEGTTVTKGSSAVLVGICVGVALGAAIILIAVVLGIRTYRKKKAQPKAGEKVPFRSVRAPETDQFKSMTTDKSASIVSASGLQPSQGTGFTSLFYKQKPKPGKRIGSHGTEDSHRRRSSQVIEKGMPNNARRGTGPIGLKLESRERAGSQGTANSHRRRSSQVTDTGSRKSAERRAGSIEPEAESATGI